MEHATPGHQGHALIPAPKIKAPPVPINPDNTLMFTTRFGSAVKYYDDGCGPLWLYQDAGGLFCIIRAQTWQDAYEIFEDEFAARVEPQDIHDAYGKTRAEWAALSDDDKQALELTEGYHYQSNSTGTGIVSIDLNGESLEPLTYELLEKHEVTMRFGDK